MKKLMMILFSFTALNASATDSLLVGEFSLAKESEVCAARVVITAAEKCYHVEVDGVASKVCGINLGPVTTKLKTLKTDSDRETTQAYQTTNVIKLGNVLTVYSTTSLKNKFYQTISRSFETTSYTATKDELFIANSRSKLSLAPNGSTVRCQYERVSQ